MSKLRDEALRVRQTAEQLFDRAAVERAFDAMAEAIQRDLGAHDPLVLCVMNGGLVASGVLLPRLDFPLRVDYLHATRYRERTTGDTLHWRCEPVQSLADRDVLVIDDILDEGYTLASVLDYCAGQGASSVRAAVLVEKLHGRGIRPPVDYIGLRVPDRYVFGYGMDYKGYWRNAPGIFAVADPPAG